jgi:hypothetical protein
LADGASLLPQAANNKDKNSDIESLESDGYSIIKFPNIKMILVICFQVLLKVQTLAQKTTIFYLIQRQKKEGKYSFPPLCLKQ